MPANTITLTSVSYNQLDSLVTLTFDNSDTDWLADTWHEILIKGSIKNACDEAQDADATTLFKTAP